MRSELILRSVYRKTIGNSCSVLFVKEWSTSLSGNLLWICVWNVFMVSWGAQSTLFTSRKITYKRENMRLSLNIMSYRQI